MTNDGYNIAAIFIDEETGEKTLWNGITEISEDLQDALDNLSEAAVVVRAEERERHDKLMALLNEHASTVNDIRYAIVDNIPYDKTPNPIYIPKHVKHRKKGRR